MTRRGRFDHRLQRVNASTICDFGDHEIAAVVAPSGEVSLIVRQQTVKLMPGDSAILTSTADAPCRIVPGSATACYLVLLRESGRQIGSA
jgi:hypothetical protein